MLELVESVTADDLIDLVIDLREDSREVVHDISEVFPVGVAQTGALDDAVEEHLVPGNPEGRLTELVIGYLARGLCVLATDLADFLVVLFQVLQVLLGCGGVQDVIRVEFEERDVLPQDESVALLVIVVIVLLLQDTIHTRVEVSDLHDR